jgi:hypothetical protein
MGFLQGAALRTVAHHHQPQASLWITLLQAL